MPPLRGIGEAVPRTRVLYARGSDLADGFPVLDLVPPSALRTSQGAPGLNVDYYARHTMDGAPLYSRTDSTVDANWHDGAPRSDMNVDDFGVRWTGSFIPPLTGTYRLGLVGAGEVQVYLDDRLLVRSGDPTHDGGCPEPRRAEAAPPRRPGRPPVGDRLDAPETDRGGP